MKICYLIASLLILLLATGCQAVGPGAVSGGELEIVDHSMTWQESGGVQVRVTVKNVGHTSIDFAEVTVTFYAAKNIVGTSKDGVTSLKPGESWDFVISCSGEGCQRVTTYQVTATATSSSRGF
jgi:hypothetical protein